VWPRGEFGEKSRKIDIISKRTIETPLGNGIMALRSTFLGIFGFFLVKWTKINQKSINFETPR
jgi:hypothetical protein